MSQVDLAFLFTFIAGFATVVGSLSIFFVKKNFDTFLSYSLAFSGGVMLYVSLAEILQKGILALNEGYDEKTAFFISLGFFFLGVILIALISLFLPKKCFPCSVKENELSPKSYKRRILILGIFSALAMAIHNFPEGITTFFSVLSGESFAIPMVVAISIHNIPEGMAVASPIYYSTGSKKKAIISSLLSAIAEPVGAIVAYLVLTPFLSPLLFGMLFSSVAGMMSYLAIVEIMPAAYEIGNKRKVNVFFFIGILAMAVSIGLFK